MIMLMLIPIFILLVIFFLITFLYVKNHVLYRNLQDFANGQKLDIVKANQLRFISDSLREHIITWPN